MTTINFRDIEQLSAYLDGELSQAEKTRLESRLASDRELASALADLRQTRSILRRMPKRRAPRNFMLTPKMAGIRPPVPRAVPALSWASAVAVLLFVCTAGFNLLGKISFGAAAPMMASAPQGMGGGYGGGAPASAENAALPTPTPEMTKFAAPEPTQQADLVPPPAVPAPKRTQPVNYWLILWPALAVLFLVAALLVRWTSQLAFKKRMRK
jgi:anti-sigma factor RsiW